MYKSKAVYYIIGRTAILLAIMISIIFLVPSSLGASSNDACFNGGCHGPSDSMPINRTLYDSNPHSVIKCIDCHVNSTNSGDSNHGKFIRQLNGSNITGPLTTKYSSQNFSLCYACHNETKVVGVLPSYPNLALHYNPPFNVSSIGTNFINNLSAGYFYDGKKNYPANIHWDHLDAFRLGLDPPYTFATDNNNIDSYTSCPTCHNVHGSNYPKMTKNDLAITYGADGNGTYGYIGSNEYNNAGGDLYCNSCHGSDTTYKYYRNEINLFEDCISCHVDNVDNIPNISLVNRTAFSQGVHVNINITDGTGRVNNSDCWTCHFNRDMNKSNIYQCADCHTGSGTPQAPQAPKVRTHLPAVTNYSCTDCHSKVIVNPGASAVNVTSHYALRPVVPTTNYCDYCHGPNASSPFPALNKTISRFNHDDPSWDGNATCRTCHTNSSVSADPLANDTSSFHELTTELGDVFNGSVKADCVLCHIQKAPSFVHAPDPPHDTTDMNTTDCYGCHGASVVGTQAQKLHDPTPTTTSGCIACHSKNNATRYYVNTSLFGLHANINTTDGMDNVTDADCKTCHFGSADGTMRMVLGAANHSNTWFCQDCHTNAGAGPIKPNATTNPNLIKDQFSHGSTDCKWCHLAGDSQPRPLNVTPPPLSVNLRYHPNGPKGTAAGLNCLDCHVSANLPDMPFHAPGEIHARSGAPTSCTPCHRNIDNHVVNPLDSHTPPTIFGFTVTTPVTSGSPALVQATIADDMTQIAAAQYQVTNTSGIVIDWTNMTPKDGRFNLSSEIVNASINTSNLKGNYTINVKGMASAPKTDTSKPYYPLNGQWSGVSSTQLTVIEARGYANGTVSGNLGNISGAIVATNTGVSTVTDANGFYSLSLVNGTYQLTASKEPEYYSNSSVTVTVTAYTSVTQNIILTLKPTGTISGTVTNT